MTHTVVQLAAEIRSFKRTEITTGRVLGHTVSQSTIRRLAKQVGKEFAAAREFAEEDNTKEVVVPEVAVVSCDGGRIRTRKPGQGRGVTLSGENGWRETKNASFERMCRNDDHIENEDPCNALPTSFRTAPKVANIAERPVPEVGKSLEETTVERVQYKGPRRVLRTALSSMACSDQFGPQMEREAKRRRFFEAPLRAFIGDGLNWNWSIWKKHFSTFIPILDFVHAIQYIFCAAMAMTEKEADGWAIYVKLVTLCWQGKIAAVIDALRAASARLGLNLDEKISDDHPLKPIVDAVRYLTNNQTRMDYPRYRALGLTVTSAPMESLIKQINHRVKGTEMFWDDPNGAEAILQIRAAALSDDDRLADYLSSRPGYPFQRRAYAATVA